MSTLQTAVNWLRAEGADMAVMVGSALLAAASFVIWLTGRPAVQRLLARIAPIVAKVRRQS